MASLLAKAVFGIAAVLGALWTGLAVWHQIATPWRWLALAGLVLGALLLLRLSAARPALAWGGLMTAALGVGLWWASIRPSNEGDWRPEVARLARVEIEGSKVAIQNLRNFTWRAPNDFDESWETRSYDLDQLTSADFISSVWGNPAIAHTFLSFGFADGSRVAFSAEVRRKKGQVFSGLDGAFKRFELALVAATEEDVIRLRTHARSEEVSIYPLRASKAQMRALFLAYLALAEELAEKPRFYHTLLTNCTTEIFRLARIVEPGVPRDWRILVSGHMADYLRDHGLIDSARPMAEIRAEAVINARALAAPPEADFSAAIRAPIPARD